MNHMPKINRRAFVAGAAAVGGGFAFGFQIDGDLRHNGGFQFGVALAGSCERDVRCTGFTRDHEFTARGNIDAIDQRHHRRNHGG